MRYQELFEGFRSELLEALGAKSIGGLSDLKPENVASVLGVLNRFFYQNYRVDNQEHLSRFKVFWEENCEEVLGFRIDESQCSRVAEVLERITSVSPHKVDANVTGLTSDLIANARYFTIIQDFIIRIKDPYTLARLKPQLFDAKAILSNFPGYTRQLLDYLGAKSQSDKREKFSRMSAELLVQDYDGSAFNIASSHGNDAKKIVDNLVSNPDPRFRKQLGFSAKKAIILVRDMMDLGVWNINNFESLDLPSDSNTMKLALRTGILRTRIPLLASYLDVYCYQYGSTDRWCRSAWRNVWEEWGKIPGNHRGTSPASFDFLIYRTGQNWKRPKMMPEVDALRAICPKETVALNAPRSISIYGATGWNKGKTDAGGGGGISS